MIGEEKIKEIERTMDLERTMIRGDVKSIQNVTARIYAMAKAIDAEQDDGESEVDFCEENINLAHEIEREIWRLKLRLETMSNSSMYLSKHREMVDTIREVMEDDVY